MTLTGRVPIHPSAARALDFFDDLFPEQMAEKTSAPVSVVLRSTDFLEQVRAFSDFGTSTVSLDDEGLPYLINEFWTA